MKTIKNGLVAAALATALSGCGAATLRNLESRDLPSEEITIMGFDGCEKEYISMDKFSYSIRCPNEGLYGLFEYQAIDNDGLGSSNFYWNDILYNDNNGDGILDSILIHYEEIQVGPSNSRLNFRYSRLLSHLQQPKIHRIWKQRWGRRE